MVFFTINPLVPVVRRVPGALAPFADALFAQDANRILQKAFKEVNSVGTTIIQQPTQDVFKKITVNATEHGLHVTYPAPYTHQPTTWFVDTAGTSPFAQHNRFAMDTTHPEVEKVLELMRKKHESLLPKVDSAMVEAVPTPVTPPPVVEAVPTPVAPSPVIEAVPAPVTPPPVIEAVPAPVTPPPVVEAVPTPVTPPPVIEAVPAPVAPPPVTEASPATSTVRSGMTESPQLVKTIMEQGTPAGFAKISDATYLDVYSNKAATRFLSHEAATSNRSGQMPFKVVEHGGNHYLTPNPSYRSTGSDPFYEVFFQGITSKEKLNAESLSELPMVQRVGNQWELVKRGEVGSSIVKAPEPELRVSKPLLQTHSTVSRLVQQPADAYVSLDLDNYQKLFATTERQLPDINFTNLATGDVNAQRNSVFKVVTHTEGGNTRYYLAPNEKHLANTNSIDAYVKLFLGYGSAYEPITSKMTPKDVPLKALPEVRREGNQWKLVNVGEFNLRLKQ
jgi:hypothetical protein